ncbi:MAG: hypothetical protein K2X76_01295 [Sphingomonas sp.]|nr:hypothetical protein [Sphingomonas sp.]
MDRSAGVEALRRAILAEPALAAALRTPLDVTEFASAAAAAAAARGIDVAVDAIAAACRPDPLGLARFAPAPLVGGGWPPEGWLPAQVAAGPAGPEFDWAAFGMGPLDDPFFADSVRRATALPFNRLMRWRLTLDELIAACPADGAAPAGLVFHLSRCGSTLLARLLAGFPGHAKLSEPEPLDAVVQWGLALSSDGARAPHPAAVAALRAVARALMHNLAPGTRAFFKLDCWHIGALPLFRAAFPETPWVFLYRDPLEVAVSQVAMPGIHVVPGMQGAAMLGLAGGEELGAEAYTAIVLGRICALAHHHAALGGGMLLHYDEIFEAILDRLPRHFGFALDAEAARRIESMRGDDAKTPGARFRPDGVAKRARATPTLRAMVERHVEPEFQRLETLRRASRGDVAVESPSAPISSGD